MASLAHAGQRHQGGDETQVRPGRDETPLLLMKGISKRFDGVVALDQVDFDLRAGEVHVLMGENGAGKSTLVKVLAGAHIPDSGTIYLEGREHRFSHPQEALQAGIAVVYQELNLVPGLSVAENLFLGREPLHPALGFINNRQLLRSAAEILDSLGVSIPLKRPVAELSVAEQQMVEIAKAYAQNARVLVLDEPTSALGEAETQRLFALIARLKARGTGIIYISHRLEELAAIGDRVTVLRDGRRVGTFSVKDVSLDHLIHLMVGRQVSEQFPARSAKHGVGDVVFSAEGVSRPPKVHDVSLYVRAGEIVGLAGLVGAGRTELARVLFGRDGMVAGRMFIDGRPVAPRSPYEAIRAGIGFLTEDRKGQGLALGMTVRENATAASLDKFIRRGVISRRKERAETSRLVDELRIRTPSVEQVVRHLSGGNQQKVVLAKWLLTDARLLIFDEPTRGIDVGARAEIYQLMRRLASEGVGILMISSDLREILGMSDRVYVMRQGRIVGEMDAAGATLERLLSLAMGGAA